MYNLQLKLLKTISSRAYEEGKKYGAMVVKARPLVQKKINEQLMASFFRFVRRQIVEKI